MKNLELWQSVEKTDPKFTKEFSAGGGFSGTSINPIYMVKQATNVFGPIGVNWGYEIIEERFDSGAPLNLGEENQQLIFEQVHTLKISLWYLHGGTKATIEHYGHTPFVYKNKFGIKTDLEAPKKSLTDAIKKALSMIGFSADIFMGMYDDIHYVNERVAESQVNNAVNKVEEKERQAAAHEEWLNTQVRLINESVNLSMLEGIFKSAARKLSAKEDQAGLLKVTRAKDAMKAKLQQTEAA